MIEFTDVWIGLEFLAGYALPAILLLAMAASLASLVFFLQRLRKESDLRMKEWAEERILPSLEKLVERSTSLEEKLKELGHLSHARHNELCERLSAQSSQQRHLFGRIEELPDLVRKKMSGINQQTPTTALPSRGNPPLGGAPPATRSPEWDRLADPAPHPGPKIVRDNEGVSAPSPTAGKSSESELIDLYQSHGDILRISTLTDDLLERLLRVGTDSRVQVPFGSHRQVTAQLRNLASAGESPHSADLGNPKWRSVSEQLRDLEIKHKDIDFFDLLDQSKDLIESGPTRGKLLDVLGLEEVVPEVGHPIKDTKNYEIENVESSGSHKVVERVTRPGFRKRETGEFLRKIGVRIKIDSSPRRGESDNN